MMTTKERLIGLLKYVRNWRKAPRESGLLGPKLSLNDVLRASATRANGDSA